MSNLDQIHELLSRHGVPDDLSTVRLSSRAKRLIFRSSVIKGIEIIIPHGVKPSWVLEMIKTRLSWVKSAQRHVSKGRGQLNPTRINLKALDETWSVKFGKFGEVQNGLIEDDEHTLLVGVDPGDIFYVARKLQGWFHQKARTSLIPWLGSLAEDRDLSFNKVYVKNQTSLWGSCSKKRNINLNRNLLFIPQHLVEYVLHHELTHLEHLDHSPRFWRSFSSVSPDSQKLRRELVSLNPDDIPLWASPGLHKI
ncbi:M48 family metallopeptidase [SAR202 cluster bacterium AD-804-J14_MRT_500m]|nr:M48 family metallopeptidase [SAR202 cluster bacterium AD-804-J14_MRT_500m]